MCVARIITLRAYERNATIVTDTLRSEARGIGEMNDSARAGVVGKARERAALPATVACSAAASISMHELRRHGRGYGRTGAKRNATTKSSPVALGPRQV